MEYIQEYNYETLKYACKLYSQDLQILAYSARLSPHPIATAWSVKGVMITAVLVLLLLLMTR